MAEIQRFRLQEGNRRGGMHLILYAKTKESDLGAGHFNCILEYGVDAGALQVFPDVLVDALLGDVVFRGCLLFSQLVGEYAPSDLYPFAWRAEHFHPP